MQDGSESWACPSGAQACYRHRDGDDPAVVISRDLMQHHERVHVVAIQALGGAQCGRSVRTVENQITAIFRKLGVSSRAELIVALSRST